MPFDCLLVGSRVMVAKEALTSDAAKDLIVKTKGVSDREWEKSYEQDAGGIITVVSELGEPIHKIATRGVLLWREFDQKFFSITKLDQQERAILKHKDWIIQRLNADAEKV
jgi:fatty acid synthase subunit beta